MKWLDRFGAWANANPTGAFIVVTLTLAGTVLAIMLGCAVIVGYVIGSVGLAVKQ